MLRNRLLPLQHVASSVHQIQLPADFKSVRAKSSNAGSSNATRQSKILGKLFGSRVAGTKRRWFPNNDANSSSSGSGYQPPSVVFQASQFGKSISIGSKHNTRRMSVLNKLFMMQITDLLATGEAAESILGRGLQVTRVKISADFSCINVYWLGSDVELEAQLQRSSGHLRHELSQLRLMGEVPRIKFVRDKTGSNINNVESTLRTLNLSKPEQEQELEQLVENDYDLAQTARREFYGNAAAPPIAKDTATSLPEMRHDVLGLDHRRIMDKILTKMRKSKHAWEQHQQQTDQFGQPAHSSLSTLDDMQRKMSKFDAEASNNEFEAFLAKRRERKQTPERKKYRREDEDWTAVAQPDCDELHLLTPEQRNRYTQEDYIVEEDKPHDYRNTKF